MSKKNSEISHLLIIIFFGLFGVHYFLDKKYKKGLIYLFTFGLFGLGWLFDIAKQIYYVYLEDKKSTSLKSNDHSFYYETFHNKMDSLSSSNIQSNDVLYDDILVFIIDQQKVSTSLLQRSYGIGYNRAARLIDAFELNGVIGPMNGSKPREVLFRNLSDYLNYKMSLSSHQNKIVNSHEGYLEEIANNQTIVSDPTLIISMRDYIVDKETFDVDDFQQSFNLNFAQTNEYIESLKLLNVINKENILNKQMDDVELLIHEAIRMNANIISTYKLDNLNDGYEFEEFTSNLLNKLGYSSEITPSSTDYGVDVLAVKNQVTYAIQCKYYSSTVGNSSVQEIVSGMKHYNAHVGIVATNNYFTRQALELAETNNIIMWDRDILLKMINKTQ